MILNYLPNIRSVNLIVYLTRYKNVYVSVKLKLLNCVSINVCMNEANSCSRLAIKAAIQLLTLKVFKNILLE